MDSNPRSPEGRVLAVVAEFAPSYGLTIRCWATIRDTVGWLMLQRRAISAPDFRRVMKLFSDFEPFGGRRAS
jgi:hypothetical protein